MRRHHKSKNGGGVDPQWMSKLQEMGCVFYAPMDQTNGFKDLISNNVGSVPSGNNNCTVTWDSSINAYVINNNKNDWAGFWWENLNLFPDMTTSDYWAKCSCTWIVTYRWMTAPPSSGNKYNSTHGFGSADGGELSSVGGSGSTRQVSEYCAPIGHGLPLTTGVWVMATGTNKWNNSGYNRTRIYYQDNGIQKSTVTENWSLKYQTRFGSRFWLAGTLPNNASPTHMAVKNVYVFNNALTATDIQRIYEHDYS